MSLTNSSDNIKVTCSQSVSELGGQIGKSKKTHALIHNTHAHTLSLFSHTHNTHTPAAHTHAHTTRTYMHAYIHTYIHTYIKTHTHINNM